MAPRSPPASQTNSSNTSTRPCDALPRSTPSSLTRRRWKMRSCRKWRMWRGRLPNYKAIDGMEIDYSHNETNPHYIGSAGHGWQALHSGSSRHCWHDCWTDCIWAFLRRDSQTVSLPRKEDLPEAFAYAAWRAEEVELPLVTALLS